MLGGLFYYYFLNFSKSKKVLFRACSKVAIFLMRSTSLPPTWGGCVAADHSTPWMWQVMLPPWHAVSWGLLPSPAWASLGCTGHASSHLSPKQNLLCPQSQATVTKSDVLVSHYSPSTWEVETEERSRPARAAQWVPTVSIPYVGRHCLKQNKTKKQKEITVWRNRKISRAGSALRDSQETVDRVFMFILKTWKADSFQNIHK